MCCQPTGHTAFVPSLVPANSAEQLCASSAGGAPLRLLCTALSSQSSMPFTMCGYCVVRFIFRSSVYRVGVGATALLMFSGCLPTPVTATLNTQQLCGSMSNLIKSGGQRGVCVC